MLSVIIPVMVKGYETSFTVYHPKNEKVLGRFVEYLPEATKGPKVTDHRLYVVYEVEGNNVVFRANPGTPYPEYATIYKN